MHREESEAIHDLTNLVMKLVVETPPMRQEMEQTVVSLSKRVDNLERIFGDLKQEINAKTGHDLDREFADMKEELFHLTSVANQETENRQAKLQALQGDLDKIKEKGGLDHHLDRLTETHNKVLETLNSGSRWSFLVSGAALVLLVAAGIALYTKFRAWEKKHIL